MYDRVLGIEDMHHFESSSAQHIGEQRSVTPPPHRFRTHQCRACGHCHFEQRSQTVGKLRAGHVIGVTAKREVAPAGIRGIRTGPSAASKPGKPVIGDAMRGERCGKYG